MCMALVPPRRTSTALDTIISPALTLLGCRLRLLTPNTSFSGLTFFQMKHYNRAVCLNQERNFMALLSNKNGKESFTEIVPV